MRTCKLCGCYLHDGKTVCLACGYDDTPPSSKDIDYQQARNIINSALVQHQAAQTKPGRKGNYIFTGSCTVEPEVFY